MLTRRAVFAVVRDGLNSNEINSQPFLLATDALTVVLEKTLESLLGCKEIKPIHPQGNQS